MARKSTAQKQAAAIAALVGGSSYTEAAKAAGVGVRTLYSWRQDESFSSELDTQQREIKERLSNKIVDTAIESVRVLKSIQAISEFDSVRVQAATAILRQAGQIIASEELNRAMAIVWRYGYVIIPENQLTDQRTNELANTYDSPTPLPWVDPEED